MSERKPRPRKRLVGTRAQRRMIDTAVASLNSHTRRLFVHVVAMTLLMLRRGEQDEGVVPVPLSKDFERAHFRHAEWSFLVDDGVLTLLPHDQSAGLCRRFVLCETWIDDYLAAGPTPEDAYNGRLVDIVGERPKPRPQRHRLSGQNGPRPPKLVKDAARSVTESLVNVTAIERHLGALRQAVTEAETEGERRKARARYWVDLSSFQHILTQNARYVETVGGDDIWSYEPAYEPQKFGRLSEIGGGRQGASRAFKQAAVLHVPGVHNYDLKSSQARGLVVLMERADLPASWLREYLGDPVGKASYADRVGVTVDTWKSLLYATLMGARVPTLRQIPYARDSSIVNVLRDEVGEDRLGEAFGRFLDATATLRDELRAWHDYLVDVWAKETGVYVAANERTYVTNAVGSKVALEDLSPDRKRHEMKAKMAAFLLQGLEASVVHRLATYGGEYGYRPMSHEHDGLVTQGAVPPEAVERAAREAGVPLWAVELVEKPFV